LKPLLVHTEYYGIVVLKYSYILRKFLFAGRKYDVTKNRSDSERMNSIRGLKWAVCRGWDGLNDVTYVT